MKKCILLVAFIASAIFVGCGINNPTAYKDLVFGMSVEEAKSNGLCEGEKLRLEDGMDIYKCKDSDFAGCHYQKAELSFRNNKLAKVHFYNSTDDPNTQREMSKKVYDYLTSKYGQARSVKKSDGWKDDNKTILLYIHVEPDSLFEYINELAICSNEFYKPSK